MFHVAGNKASETDFTTFQIGVGNILKYSCLPFDKNTPAFIQNTPGIMEKPAYIKTKPTRIIFKSLETCFQFSFILF